MKYQTIAYFLITAPLITTPLFGVFDSLWYETQNIYKKIMQSLENAQLLEKDKKESHPEWLQFRQCIQDHILSPPQRNFLNTPSIEATMLRIGMGQAQQFELNYLKKIQPSIPPLIRTFIETDFHAVPKECTELNCTSTSLCHLFYLAKILETGLAYGLESFQTVVEFGGGFGNLCRIIKQLFPQTTYILFDVPEVIALQYLFLKGSSPHHSLKVHFNRGESIQKNAINLIPSVFCNDTDVQADLFISTFALSETTEKMQECLNIKKYYNAPLCYITGQKYQKTAVTYVNHEIIQNSVHALYNKVILTPFHTPINCDCTYELIGIKYNE